MITTTHALMAATAGVALKRRGQQVPLRWLVIGGLAPDVMLYGLSLGYGIALYNGWLGSERLFGPLYDALYFTNPFWIVGYNALHAPLMVAALIALGLWLWRRGAAWAALLFWFAIGCAVHTAGDIPTHHNDGPLLLFPFHWSLRFHAPISYWDPRYGGEQFAIFELALTLALIAYLGGPALFRWAQSRLNDTPEQHDYPD